MQTVTDKKSLLRAGVDEKVINFRPSPNFLNMKRFLKKKIVDTQNVKGTPASLAAEPLPKKECDMPIIKKKENLVQPPLPQYPPPPDSPPLLDIVKKEVEDDSYETNATLEAENASLQLEPVKQACPEEKKPLMCKDFVRGSCIRKQCKFSHQIDLTQLDGVYIFCWNYQNKGCNKPNCKHVHANQFEEGEFFRTGFLPPSAVARIKKPNMLQPPSTLPKETPPKMPIFSYPPPPIFNNGEKVESNGVPVEPAATKPNLKREWSEVEDASASNDELEDQSNCKFCVDMEFRLQYNKGNVEKLSRASAELDDKLRAADRKLHKLYSVLAMLLKPHAHKVSQSPLHGLAMVAGDKDKNMLEQLAALLGSHGGR